MKGGRCEGPGPHGGEVWRSHRAGKLLCANCFAAFGTQGDETGPIETSGSVSPPNQPYVSMGRLYGSANGSMGEARETDKTVARARILGIDVPLGERFECILPQHASHPAVLRPTRRGFWHLECLAEKVSLGLGEVRAARAYDALGRRGVEVSRWGERLDYEAKLLVPRPFPIVLPEGAPDSLRRVARGWQLLVGLRHPMWGNDPFTFARRFVMAYCGVTDQQARDQVRALERLGYMRRVHVPPPGSRQPILYRPASGSAERAA